MIQAAHSKVALTVHKRTQEQTRTVIIQAAGEVFAELGYQAATTREICSRADVNIAAVNYHFRDKLGLYTEILETACIYQQLPEVEAAMATSTPEEALRLFLVGMFNQLGNPERPAWYFKVMIHELANPTPGLSAVVDHVIRPNALVLCTLIGRIIDRPAADMKTRLCVHSVIGQVVHFVHGRPIMKLLWPEWKISTDALAEIADHIAAFSIAALKEMAKTPTS